MNEHCQWPLSQRCNRHIEHELLCPDRMIFRGYAPMWQSGGGLLNVHGRIRPNKPLTKSWLNGLRQRFTDGVRRFADEHGIPILKRERRDEERQEDQVAQYREAFKRSEGIYAILKVRADMPVWRSHEPQYPVDDPNYRLLSRPYCNIDVYYFYGISERWGPFWVSIWSNPPFSCQVYINGHEWLAREARREGLEVRTADNVIVGVSDPEHLQRLADRLLKNPREVQRFCDRWAYRLLPVLSREERREMDFRYQWCMAQTELSHDMHFSRRDSCEDFFQRLIDCNRRWTGPYTVKEVFGRKRAPHPERVTFGVHGQYDTLTVMKLTYHNASLKQYNPGCARDFRTECTSNDPLVFGVKRRLCNWAQLIDRLRGCIWSLQECQHGVMTPCLATGALGRLGQGVDLGTRRVGGVRLDQRRTVSVLAALGSPWWLELGVTNRELRPLVEQRLGEEYTAGQMRYDLSKLTGHGFLRRQGHRYWPTPEGHRQLLGLTQLAQGVLEPLVAGTTAEVGDTSSCRTGLEEPLRDWRRQLDHICDTLCVGVAPM